MRVRNCRVRPTRRRRLTILECQVADDTGPLKAVWFNQAYLADQLKEGVGAAAARAARGGPRRRRPSASPSTRSSAAPDEGPGAPHDRPRAGLSGDGGTVGAAHPRAGLGACAACSATRSSRCPRGCARSARLPSRADALAAAHWPELLEDVPVARRRLALEELFLFQLALVMRRRTRREVGEAEAVAPPGDARAQLARVPAVRAHRRPAPRGRGDRRRPRERRARCSAC